MTVGNSVLFIVLSTFAVSYGWGMRGTTIGGEKGAMLPGAIMGMLIALFSGFSTISAEFYILAALGGIAMYFGGCMTYGETLGLSMNRRPAENMKKGLIAVFVKGFLWFGVFGGVVSLGLTVLSGQYFNIKEVYGIFLLLPVFMLMFFFIFNRPLNPAKKIFPKIYFSKTRKESWGALFGLLLEILLIAVFKKVYFILGYSLICAVFGAVGWVIGQLIHVFCRQYSARSTNCFLKLFSKPWVDSWKIMECVLGAFGGLGASLGIVLFYGKFSEIVSHGFIWNQIKHLDTPLTVALLVLIVVQMLQYFVNNKRINRIFEYAEMPLYAIIPMFLLFIGSRQIAVLFSFTIILLVLLQEVCLEKKDKPGPRIGPKLISLIIIGFLLYLQFFKNYSFTVMQALLMYGAGYELITLFSLVPEVNIKRKNNGNKPLNGIEFFTKTSWGSVHSYFALCIIAVTIAVGLFIR